MPRVPVADETRNLLEHQVIGNKGDTAVSSPGTTTSLLAYLKGLMPVEATGTADVDISEADYTADYVTLLTITPATGENLIDLCIDLDVNKATTGWDTIATAADTLDVVVQSKIDGTNWRTLMTGTQIAANGDGSLLGNESGQRFNVGPVGEDAEVRVAVLLSTERDDCEIPYRVTYRGATPTITPVAAA